MEYDEASIRTDADLVLCKEEDCTEVELLSKHELCNSIDTAASSQSSVSLTNTMDIHSTGCLVNEDSADNLSDKNIIEYLKPQLACNFPHTVSQSEDTPCDNIDDNEKTNFALGISSTNEEYFPSFQSCAQMQKPCVLRDTSQIDTSKLPTVNLDEYQDSSSDYTSTDDSSSDSDNDIDILAFSSDDETNNSTTKIVPLKTKPTNSHNTASLLSDYYAELRIEEKEIILPESVVLTQVGHVSYILEEQLAVIKTDQDVPPLNLDSCLFLENRKLLGKVYEIFGPVKLPYYVVGMQKGTAQCNDKVFYTSQTKEYFQYALTSSLLKMKGSDASWIGDEEPPANCLDYSDDEAERQSRRERKEQRKLLAVSSNTTAENNTNVNKGNKRKYNQSKHSWRNHSQVYNNQTNNPFKECQDSWFSAITGMANMRQTRNMSMPRPLNLVPNVNPFNPQLPPPPSMTSTVCQVANSHGGLVRMPPTYITPPIFNPPMFSQSLFNPNIPPPPPTALNQIFCTPTTSSNSRSSMFSHCMTPPPPPPPPV